MSAVQNVVIVGGGIGGLTLAAALRRVGIAVRVIEKGDRSSRLGTGISLLGNAMRALDTIGLAEPCVEAGYGYDKVKTRDQSGHLVDEMHPPRTFRPDRPGAFGIMRPVLADILEQAATDSGATIDFETMVASIEQRPEGLDLVLSSGERVTTELLVGADGVYSATRSAIFGDGLKPEYCGQGGIRYTAPRPKEMDGITFYRTQNGRPVGAIPLSDEHCYYFVLENGERHGHLGGQQLANLWKERMAPFTAPDLVMIAEAATSSSPLSYRPFDVMMLPRPWHRGRVLLIGDAVHSLSPQLTSGGGMAIEDAIVLAQILDEATDLETALETFGARREPRVRSIHETSLAICKLEQNPSPEGHKRGMELLGKGLRLLAEPF